MSPSTNKSWSIASIPADGIGPEVIAAGIEVLQALTETLKTFTLDFHHYDWSSETYRRTGKYIPDGGLEELKKHDAILFGAVGAPGTHPPPFLIDSTITLNAYQKMSLITSPSGASASPSASPYSNTPMCGPRVSCAARNHPSDAASPVTLTG